MGMESVTPPNLFIPSSLHQERVPPPTLTNSLEHPWHDIPPLLKIMIIMTLLPYITLSCPLGLYPTTTIHYPWVSTPTLYTWAGMKMTYG
jgi:hypothetical protein